MAEMTPFDRLILPGLMLFTAVGGVQLSGLALHLGAHPGWAQKVVWAGLPLGIGLAMTAWALRVRRAMRLQGFALLTLAAFAIAKAGEMRFAASVAQDALAGQAWYFGWITTSASTAAILASLFRYDRRTD